MIYWIFVITLIACGKLPVMSRLECYLEVTRIQGRNQDFKKNLVSTCVKYLANISLRNRRGWGAPPHSRKREGTRGFPFIFRLCPSALRSRNAQTKSVPANLAGHLRPHVVLDNDPDSLLGRCYHVYQTVYTEEFASLWKSLV